MTPLPAAAPTVPLNAPILMSPQSASGPATANGQPSFEDVRQEIEITQINAAGQSTQQTPAPEKADTQTPPPAPRPPVTMTAAPPMPMTPFGGAIASATPASTAALFEEAGAAETDESGQAPSASGNPVGVNALMSTLLTTMPQFVAPSSDRPTSSGSAKALASVSLATAAHTPLFFEDTDGASADVADFASDLLAALGSSAPSAQPIDVKATARIDAPRQAGPLPELDLTNDAWLDQLARDITATASHDGKLSFRIVPPQLGKLDIHVEARDAGLAVHMKAETREAQAILTAAQPRLESALGQNGVRVTETSVASNGQENQPKPHFIPQKAQIEAVNEREPEADTPTAGRAAGRFA